MPLLTICTHFIKHVPKFPSETIQYLLINVWTKKHKEVCHSTQCSYRLCCRLSWLLYVNALHTAGKAISHTRRILSQWYGFWTHLFDINTKSTFLPHQTVQPRFWINSNVGVIAQCEQLLLAQTQQRHFNILSWQNIKQEIWKIEIWNLCERFHYPRTTMLLSRSRIRTSELCVNDPLVSSSHKLAEGKNRDNDAWFFIILFASFRFSWKSLSSSVLLLM